MINKNGRSNMITLAGFEYISKTRDYLDYLEEHFKNIERAFEEVVKALDGTAIIGDDYAYWTMLRSDVVYHDISKFSEEEFVAYRAKFYPVEDSPELYDCFEPAWENHKKENNHHWESICNEDEGKVGLIERNIFHRSIDWTAMGYKFGNTAHDYYMNTHDKIVIPEKYIPFLEDVFYRLQTAKECK